MNRKADHETVEIREKPLGNLLFQGRRCDPESVHFALVLLRPPSLGVDDVPLMHPAPIPRQCCHCQTAFQPDYRNLYHQRFCSHPQCRRASKRASQQQWLQRPENQGYFRGPEHVRRVKEWRKAHPHYWKPANPAEASTLQEDIVISSSRVVVKGRCI